MVSTPERFTNNNPISPMSELLNQSSRQLKQELRSGKRGKSEK